MPLLAVLLACVFVMVPARATHEEQSFAEGRTNLIIGKVSRKPRKHVRKMLPIAQYAAERMADLGITGAAVRLAKDNDHLVALLREGKIDWVSETVFSALELEESAGAEVLVLKWKGSVAEYHSIFIIRADSDVTRLEDLNGRVVAFEDPGSTSAFFMPAASLVRAGLDLVELRTPRDRPPPDKVGYVFAGDELNISTWVHRGLVAAGALSNLDWDRDDHLPKALRRDLEIFHRTAPVPRAVELVRGDLPDEMKERLRDILIGASYDPQAAHALRAYQNTARFADFTPETVEAFQRARQSLRAVRERL